MTSRLEDLFIGTLRTAKDRLHRDCGAVSQVRLATLRFIAERRAASMKDLAAHLRITRPSATLLVDHLAAKKLVRRRSDARDRRGVILSLTPGGRKALADGVRALGAAVRALLRPLPSADRKALARILSRLLEAHASN